MDRIECMRSLHLTTAGADYYDAALGVLASLDEAEERVRAGAGRLEGILRINAPVSFGVRILGPLLPAFHVENPHVQLQISLSDQLLDPIKNGFDVTIRIANLADSSLAARILMPAERVMVASPAYLKAAGTPRSPEDLAQHAFLGYGNVQGGVLLAMTRKGETSRIQPVGPAIADNGDLLAKLAEGDMGITLLPRFIVQDCIDEGRLVVVLQEWHAPSINVHAVFAATRNLPKKTRAFVDFLIERLNADRLDA